jgi:hypothetical protein
MRPSPLKLVIQSIIVLRVPSIPESCRRSCQSKRRQAGLSMAAGRHIARLERRVRRHVSARLGQSENSMRKGIDKRSECSYYMCTVPMSYDGSALTQTGSHGSWFVA